MRIEQLHQFKASELWEGFCEELDAWIDREITSYDSCKDIDDFCKVQERVRILRTIKDYPGILIEHREGS